MPQKYTTEQRLEAFWSKINKHGPVPIHAPSLGPCWLWTGGCDRDGYGQVIILPHSYRAHRITYELLVGPIPDGFQCDHLCRNPTCVNPNHIEPVTRKTNILRSNAPSARNALKTHCPQGHAYDERNTRHYKGMRFCRACAREHRPKHPRVLKTHCPKNHPYNEANTRHYKTMRFCRGV